MIARRAVAAVSVIMLAGCAPARAPDVQGAVARAFIDIRRAPSGAAFSDAFRDELAAELGRRGVRCAAGEHDRGAADDGGAAIRESYPDLVIALVQTDSNGAADRAEFALAVFRPNSSAPVWNEILSPETGGWTAGSAAGIADRTAAKLDEAGLLGQRGESK